MKGAFSVLVYILTLGPFTPAHSSASALPLHKKVGRSPPPKNLRGQAGPRPRRISIENLTRKIRADGAKMFSWIESNSDYFLDRNFLAPRVSGIQGATEEEGATIAFLDNVLGNRLFTNMALHLKKAVVEARKSRRMDEHGQPLEWSNDHFISRVLSLVLLVPVTGLFYTDWAVSRFFSSNTDILLSFCIFAAIAAISLLTLYDALVQVPEMSMWGHFISSVIFAGTAVSGLYIIYIIPQLHEHDVPYSYSDDSFLFRRRSGKNA